MSHSCQGAVSTPRTATTGRQSMVGLDAGICADVGSTITHSSAEVSGAGTCCQVLSTQPSVPSVHISLLTDRRNNSTTPTTRVSRTPLLTNDRTCPSLSRPERHSVANDGQSSSSLQPQTQGPYTPRQKLLGRIGVGTRSDARGRCPPSSLRYVSNDTARNVNHQPHPGRVAAAIAQTRRVNSIIQMGSTSVSPRRAFPCTPSVSALRVPSASLSPLQVEHKQEGLYPFPATLPSPIGLHHQILRGVSRRELPRRMLPHADASPVWTVLPQRSELVFGGQSRYSKVIP